MVNVSEDAKPRPTRRMGHRIRAAREAKELSTQAAAASARISPGYLFKLESGLVGTPSPRVLHRVGGVLDIGYWELMRLAGYATPGDEDMPPAQAHEEGDEMQEPPTNERIVELLEAIRAELAEVRQAQAELSDALRKA
jgi:transcriptional regulator with XRE-family HTH domain